MKGNSLIDIYEQWREAVVSYLPVWTALRELDRICWVLDPDPPTPAHLYRLGCNLSFCHVPRLFTVKYLKK